ncbi:MAG TPA: hypothetical protein VN086_03315 [Candidatus Paceibacterota bacterium]|nr:hypothetical protein [Candidatus Paceibacterota bacterium]
MKKFLGIAAVILFFLILLALLVAKLFFSSPKAAPSTASDPFQNLNTTVQPISTNSAPQTAEACFRWYLTVFLTPSTVEQRAALPQAGECFTSSFLSQWSAIVATNEGDPVLTVNDYAKSWSSSIHAQTIGQSVHTSDQEVVLGTADEQLTVIAHLVQQPDLSWKIDSVSKPY